MWKAFEEMEALGWIGSERPKMVAVQSAGCAPIVKAWDEGTARLPNSGRMPRLWRLDFASPRPMATT